MEHGLRELIPAALNDFLESLLRLLHLQLEVIRELHLEGLSAGDQGEGARQVLHDEVRCLEDPRPVEVEGKVLEDELSRGDKGDGHGTVDHGGEDLDDGLGDGVGEDLSQVSFLLLGQRFLA